MRKKEFIAMKKVIYVPNAPEHIYQRAADRGVIFYRVEDYLVLFTIISIIVKRNNIRVMSLCFMINHLHMLASSMLSTQRSMAIDAYTSMYAKHYNRHYDHKGHLFGKEFGRAMKIGSKKVRTCLAYIANNPVEKAICRKATEYRWNFLAYYNNDHPFSEPIIPSRCTKWMKIAIETVDRTYDDGNYLRYEVLEFITRHLCPSEKEQLADYIISTYNFIDYEMAISYFGDYDKMVAAFDYNTGSEYDIREEWSNEPDTVFDQMLEVLNSQGLISRKARNIFHLDEEKTSSLVQQLLMQTGCGAYHIHKLLHIPMDEAKQLLGR